MEGGGWRDGEEREGEKTVGTGNKGLINTLLLSLRSPNLHLDVKATRSPSSGAQEGVQCGEKTSCQPRSCFMKAV